MTSDQLPAAMRRITIQNLEVSCIMGVYPEERVSPQPVLIDAELWLAASPSDREAPPGLAVDYARRAETLRFILEQGQFFWLETAAEALVGELLLPELDGLALVEAVRVRLTKPRAFGGRGAPSFELTRQLQGRAPLTAETPPGLMRVTHVGPDATVFRLVVNEGGSTPVFASTGSEVAELALGDGLVVGGERWPCHTGGLWPVGVPRQYQNLGAAPVELLGVARPWLDRGTSGWLVWRDGSPAIEPLSPARRLSYRLGRSPEQAF